MSTRVTIGIQARSSSRRLPGKIFETLGNRSVLRHVMDSCSKAALYINNWGTKKIHVDVALCIPTGDSIKRRFSEDVPIIEGPEDDVLTRYALLAEKMKPDYLVRITSDCPLIPSFVISKCITTAVMGQYDYFSNVDEKCRTSADGMDCEVISKSLFQWVNQNAKLPTDREHVTSLIRSQRPEGFKQGIIINFLDLSHLKLSLDTAEDLQVIKTQFDKIQNALIRAQDIFGRQNVHRF